MTTIAAHGPAPFVGPAAGPGLFRRVRRVLRAGATFLRLRRNRRGLAELSDRTLKDIGLRRCEIDSIADTVADGGWDMTRMPRGHIAF